MHLMNSDLIAVDCEMVETKGGRDELAHVSLVSSKGVLYDKYVLPTGKITDYRTAWSGITPAILKDCTNRKSSRFSPTSHPGRIHRYSARSVFSPDQPPNHPRRSFP